MRQVVDHARCPRNQEGLRVARETRAVDLRHSPGVETTTAVVELLDLEPLWRRSLARTGAVIEMRYFGG